MGVPNLWICLKITQKSFSYPAPANRSDNPAWYIYIWVFPHSLNSTQRSHPLEDQKFSPKPVTCKHGKSRHYRFRVLSFCLGFSCWFFGFGEACGTHLVILPHLTERERESLVGIDFGARGQGWVRWRKVTHRKVKKRKKGGQFNCRWTSGTLDCAQFVFVSSIWSQCPTIWNAIILSIFSGNSDQ